MYLEAKASLDGDSGFTIDFLHLVDGPPTMQAAWNIDLVANKSSFTDLPLIFSSQADSQPSW